MRVDDDGHLLAVPRRHDEEKDGPAAAHRDRSARLARRRRPRRRRPRARLAEAPRQEHLRGPHHPPPRQRPEEDPRPLRGARRPQRHRPRDARPTASCDASSTSGRPTRTAPSRATSSGSRPAGGALSRRAKVIERVGPMSDPRTVSLISIAANDIPVEFPEAAARGSRARQGRAAGRSPRPARHAAGHDRRRGCARLRRRGVRRARSRTIPAAGACWSPSPTSPGTCGHDKPLDRAAYRRGTSVYFPDRVVPMLPEALSNDWCSLVPREDRPVLVAEMSIDAEGHLKRHRFHRAMMRSARAAHLHPRAARHRRHTRRRDRAADGAASSARSTAPTRCCWRRARSAARSTSTCPSARSRWASDGRIAEIGVRERLDSHKLIEEFMVLANVAAAQALEQRHAPCLYRVHDQPDAAKLEALREFLGTLGIAVPIGQRLRPADLNRVLQPGRGQAGGAAGQRDRSCAARARRSTAPTISAISAWRWRATPTSPRRSAAIPT